jgi:hypothetical protein
MGESEGEFAQQINLARQADRTTAVNKCIPKCLLKQAVMGLCMRLVQANTLERANQRAQKQGATRTS